MQHLLKQARKGSSNHDPHKRVHVYMVGVGGMSYV